MERSRRGRLLRTWGREGIGEGEIRAPDAQRKRFGAPSEEGLRQGQQRARGEVVAEGGRLVSSGAQAAAADLARRVMSAGIDEEDPICAGEPLGQLGGSTGAGGSRRRVPPTARVPVVPGRARRGRRRRGAGLPQPITSTRGIIAAAVGGAGCRRGLRSSTTSGIRPNAWVEQLRQGSKARMTASRRLRAPSGDVVAVDEALGHLAHAAVHGEIVVAGGDDQVDPG